MAGAADTPGSALINWRLLVTSGVTHTHAKISYQNPIELNRNQIVFTIFRLIWNQTDDHLLFQIKHKMVNITWFQFDIIIFLCYTRKIIRTFSARNMVYSIRSRIQLKIVYSVKQRWVWSVLRWVNRITRSCWFLGHWESDSLYIFNIVHSVIATSKHRFINF